MVALRRAWETGAAAIGALALVLVPAALFLAKYSLAAPTVPLGFDTPLYIWQAKEAAAAGLADPSLVTRPGFSLLAAALQGILPIPEEQLIPVLAFTLPGLVGLAAAGTVRITLGPGALRVAAAGLAVATSFLVARLAGGLFANLLTLLFLAAVIGPLATSVAGRGGLAAAFVLLLAAGLTHWMFLTIFGVVLAAALALYVVARSLLHRPVPPLRRLGLLLAVGAAASALALVIVFPLLGGGVNLSGVTRLANTFLYRYRKWRAELGYVPVFSLMAMGAAMLSRETEDRPGGFVRILMAGWLGVTVVAVVGALVWKEIPLHRFLLFALPIPLLAGIGAEGVGRLSGLAVSRAGPTAVWGLRLAVTGSLVMALAIPGLRLVHGGGIAASITPEELQAGANLGAYVSSTPRGHPTVVAIRVEFGRRVAYTRQDESIIRSALPGDRQEDVLFYWGRPNPLLAGRPTPFKHPGVQRASLERWAEVAALDEPYSVAILEAFHPEAFAAAAGSGSDEVAPGLLILRGPAPPSPLPPAEPPPPPLLGVPAGTLATALVLVLGIIGLVWSAALFPGAGAFGSFAMAPALGGAVLVPVALVVQALGISLGGAGGPVAAGVSMAGGLAVWLGLRRAQARQPDS
jgi:hypothetical protein